MSPRSGHRVGDGLLGAGVAHIGLQLHPPGAEHLEGVSEQRELGVRVHRRPPHAGRVVTFRSNQHNLALAAAGAGAAVLAAAGLAVRAPLSRVPENSMMFAVGVMLTAFGMFWGAEGAGASWSGSDAALLVLVPATTLYTLALVALFRRQRVADPATASPAATVATAGRR